MNIKEIPTNNYYTGYLWLSDNQEPCIYVNQQLDDVIKKSMDDNANPFIIEGQLFDGVFSYSIKYVDGEHKVSKYNVKEECANGYTKLHHFKGSSKLKGHNLLFYEIWKAVPDPICSQMEVFEAKAMIFGGFE